MPLDQLPQERCVTQFRQEVDKGAKSTLSHRYPTAAKSLDTPTEGTFLTLCVRYFQTRVAAVPTSVSLFNKWQVAVVVTVLTYFTCLT